MHMALIDLIKMVSILMVQDSAAARSLVVPVPSLENEGRPLETIPNLMIFH